MTHQGVQHEVRLSNPRPRAVLVELLEDCYQVRIAVLNNAGAHLEFRRYRVELWDEDADYAEFFVDSLEFRTRANTASNQKSPCVSTDLSRLPQAASAALVT